MVSRFILCLCADQSPGLFFTYVLVNILFWSISENLFPARTQHRAYSFYLEFIFNNLCSRPEIRSRRENTPPFSGKMFACILDLEGFNPFHLTLNVVKYCVKVSKLNESHYPMSGQQGIFINAPNWLVNSFAFLTHLVPENNKDSIIFLSKSNMEGLKELIDEDQIPKRYGGTSTYDFDKHPYMQDFYRVVDQANANPFPLSG